MSFLDRLLGNDHERAANRYPGRESASDRAARKRRESHRRNITKAAAAAERWQQQDRDRDRRGGWRRTDWN